MLDRRRFRGRGFRGWRAEDRLHARDELTGVERLGQIVVGAHLEPDDLVDVVVAGGEHEDRDVGRLPDPAAHVDPVDIGEHEVEHDQRRSLGRDLVDRRAPGPAARTPKPAFLRYMPMKDAMLPSSSTTRMDWLLAGVTRFLSCQRPGEGRRAAGASRRGESVCGWPATKRYAPPSIEKRPRAPSRSSVR